MSLFQPGDRVIHTTNHGIIIEATVIELRDDSTLALKFGNRLGFASPQSCRLKSKRIVRSRQLKSKIGDSTRSISGPELFTL